MYRRQRGTDGSRRSQADLVLGPEEVRLGVGGRRSRAWRGSGSTRPRRQVHRRQTARGVRRPQAARGTRCPQRGGWWPGRGPRERTRAPGTEAGQESSSATWPTSPHLNAGSFGGAYPGARPPGLPASRSAPTSGARPAAPAPAPARLGSRAPVWAATGEQRRDGRHDPQGGVGRGAARRQVAGGERAHSTARARRPRRALPGLGRPRCSRSAPTRRSPAQAQSDWPSMTSRPAPSQVSLDVAEVAGPSQGRGLQREGL